MPWGFHLHHHHHHHADPEELAWRHMVLALFHDLTHQGAQLMAKIDDMRAELDGIKAAVANVSGDIDDLLAQATGGVTPADADAFVTDLRAVKDALDAVAAKHETPAPPAPPAPPTP